MELQIPYSVCTKVPAASDLSTNQSGHREDNTTVMRNKERIAEYIRNQLEEDIMGDQISFKEYIDPFTGSKNTKA